MDYWRVNYGIHLVGYATTERTDKSRDHGTLLKLLDGLLVSPPYATPLSGVSSYASCSPDTVLALARHAARLTRALKCDPELPIRVYSEKIGRAKARSEFKPDEFDHWPVLRFLEEGPARAILIGAPGSGKSYSLQRAAARLADKLHEGCLSEKFNERNVVVPIFADLKLYRGDLLDLVNRTLPSGMSLGQIIPRFTVKIFLDSFNEMPCEYWDSGSYEADFAKFVAENASASLIVGSRTSDGLSKLGFPFYRLHQIDEGFVTTELGRLRIDVGGRFEREIRRLLQRPFYFQLVASGAVILPTDAHPKDFYRAFFVRLANSFQERFGVAFNLEYALSLAAFEAIDQGEEAQPLSNLLDILQGQLKGAGLGEIHASDVANWSPDLFSFHFEVHESHSFILKTAVQDIKHQ